MSKKSNNKNKEEITIPSEVHYEEEEDDTSVVDQDRLERSLSEDDDDYPPPPLDPTIEQTGSLGDIKAANKNKKTRTRRSKAAMSVFSRVKKEEQEKKGQFLKISEKRRLSYSILRSLQRNEMLVDKVVKYFVTANLLLDPFKQKIAVGLKVNRRTNELVVEINFNVLENTEVNQNSMLTGLKNKLKETIPNVRIVPVQTKNSEKEVSFNISRKIVDVKEE
jgi:hypothetical protein